MNLFLTLFVFVLFFLAIFYFIIIYFTFYSFKFAETLKQFVAYRKPDDEMFFNGIVLDWSCTCLKRGDNYPKREHAKVTNGTHQLRKLECVGRFSQSLLLILFPDTRFG